MPKFSPKQDVTFALLSDSLAMVAGHAESDADKALAALATRAEFFGSVWVRCNTESGGRGEMRAHARALVERATTDSHSLVSFAFMALGKAFQEFASCEYRKANEYAAKACALATTPLVHVQQVMARA